MKQTNPKMRSGLWLLIIAILGIVLAAVLLYPMGDDRIAEPDIQTDEMVPVELPGPPEESVLEPATGTADEAVTGEDDAGTG